MHSLLAASSRGNAACDFTSAPEETDGQQSLLYRTKQMAST
jgi:hypothetical protein